MWWRKAGCGTLDCPIPMEAPMFRFASPLTLKLARGELLAWKQGAAKVRVVSGWVWITCRDDNVDHFIFAGQTFDLRAGCAMLIGAEEDAHLRFETCNRLNGLRLPSLWPRLQSWGEQNKISLRLQ
jgi:hypothetical protein